MTGGIPVERAQVFSLKMTYKFEWNNNQDLAKMGTGKILSNDNGRLKVLITS